MTHVRPRVSQAMAPHLSPWTRGSWGLRMRTEHLRPWGVVTETTATSRGQVPGLVMMRQGEPVIRHIGDPDPTIGAPGRQLIGVRVIRVRAGGGAGGALGPLVLLHHPAIGVDLSQPRPP